MAHLSLSAVYGLRDFENTSAGHLATVSLEDDLADRLTISTGYRFVREDGTLQHTAGLLLSYDFSLG